MEFIDYRDLWEDEAYAQDAPVEVCYSELLMIYKNNEYDMVNRQEMDWDTEETVWRRESGRNRRNKRNSRHRGTESCGLHNNGRTVYSSGFDEDPFGSSLDIDNYVGHPTVDNEGTPEDPVEDPWWDAYGEGNTGNNGFGDETDDGIITAAYMDGPHEHMYPNSCSILGPYFICNIEDRMKIAHLLDEYTHDQMSLYDKHVFSSCPLKIPDESVSRYSLSEMMFRQWVWDFVKLRKVKLKLKLKHGLMQDAIDGLSDSTATMKKGSKKKGKLRHKKVGMIDLTSHALIPKTPEQMLKLETLHQLIEVYIWLGMRYPDAFYELEQAKKLCSECNDLINKGIEMNGNVKRSKF